MSSRFFGECWHSSKCFLSQNSHHSSLKNETERPFAEEPQVFPDRYNRQHAPRTTVSFAILIGILFEIFFSWHSRSYLVVLRPDPYTHSRICLRIEYFLNPCQYKTTINHFSQFLIQIGMNAVSGLRF